MYSKRYTAALTVVTSVTLLMAFLLWNSEDSHVIETEPAAAGVGAFIRGAQDVPGVITIDTYVDFT